MARLTVEDRAFRLLGPAWYVSHESERAMAIIWQLAHELPGDLFAQFWQLPPDLEAGRT